MPETPATTLSNDTAGRPLVVIPARLGSTRLPGKMLLRRTGKPLVQHTYEAACRARLPQGVVVATDSPEIAAAVRQFSGRVEMTRTDHASGTDRVAEVTARFPAVDCFINVQGDEPEIDPEVIDALAALLENHPTAPMATLATPIRTLTQLRDPACVKVVVDRQGHALYFSRSPVPFARAGAEAMLGCEPPVCYQHLGVYAYRREFLLWLSQTPASPLERIEGLEQLRVLESGRQILVGVVDHASQGIDTQDDYSAFVARWQADAGRAAAA